ncbi:MAG UNVERIFIED_CONTAM: hypothetical protein LVR18_27150 [Planctomycetaceae bacterium]
MPDDVLLELGVLPQRTSAGIPTLEALQHWPGPKNGKYETRRDLFNSRLKDLHANYCLCPPVGWEHPYAWSRRQTAGSAGVSRPRNYCAEGKGR